MKKSQKSSGSVTLKRGKKAKAALGTYHKGIKNVSKGNVSGKKASEVKLVSSK